MQQNKQDARKKRHWRSRHKIKGVASRPRLCVFRSNCHIYAQLIDDVAGSVLASASSIDGALQGSVKNGSNQDAAKLVGKAIAERALAKEIKAVVFDKGGFKYHGRVKALADAARESGLQF